MFTSTIEREKTHVLNLPLRQQLRVTTSDILNVEIDVGRMTSWVSRARSRCLLPTGPRSQIDPGTWLA